MRAVCPFSDLETIYRKGIIQINFQLSCEIPWLMQRFSTARHLRRRLRSTRPAKSSLYFAALTLHVTPAPHFRWVKIAQDLGRIHQFGWPCDSGFWLTHWEGSAFPRERSLDHFFQAFLQRWHCWHVQHLRHLTVAHGFLRGSLLSGQ